MMDTDDIYNMSVLDDADAALGGVKDGHGAHGIDEHLPSDDESLASGSRTPRTFSSERTTFISQVFAEPLFLSKLNHQIAIFHACSTSQVHLDPVLGGYLGKQWYQG